MEKNKKINITSPDRIDMHVTPHLSLEVNKTDKPLFQITSKPKPRVSQLSFNIPCTNKHLLGFGVQTLIHKVFEGI